MNSEDSQSGLYFGSQPMDIRFKEFSTILGLMKYVEKRLLKFLRTK